MSPRISVLTPVYNPPLHVLQETIDSVVRQTFADWELCLVNDFSTDAGVAALLDAAALTDSRIRVMHRAENGGITAASADALAMATGEFVALLDHDDLLNEAALAGVVEIADIHDDFDYSYSDEAHLSPEGKKRADALPDLFKKERPDPFPTPDFILATHASKHSNRAVETVTPLAKALSLKVDATYADEEYPNLVEHLCTTPKYEGKTVLICWHHGTLPELAAKLGVPFLGEIPLDAVIRAGSDQGMPVVVTDPDGAHAKVYRAIAEAVWTGLDRGRANAAI